MSSSRSSSLTPLRSPSPSPPTQPDHFYGVGDVQLPPSPSSDGKTWLDPEDDPLAHRGIPVFKPTMEEFRDFEGYVSRIECWGMKSGIVKIIPPKEWSDSLPSLKEQLVSAKIRTPIEQHMFGSGGRFRQENMEKRRVMSTREWFELCAKDEFRAPGVGEVGLQARSTYVRPRIRKSKRTETGPEQAPSIKEEPVDAQPLDFAGLNSAKDQAAALSPPNSVSTPRSPVSQPAAIADDELDAKPQAKKKRVGSSRQAREAALADRASQDLKFLATFDPHKDWLPPNTTAADYTPEFCQILERHYWRNCSLGKSAWYGADTAGTLFTDDTSVWNVGKLPSALSRLLPPNQSLPGVNTPYLYFGMWRATFAWHVEDMDLFSINYIHFGAPKFWYAIPQGRACALEQAMKGFFPKDSKCSQFLRHKSFLASPTTLAQSSCRPNFLVQHSGEFVITFPRGYHAGFNLGFNCAESVNFALESWIELGRRAKACECVGDSVTIDVDQLLADRAAEAGDPPPAVAFVPKKKAKVKRVTVKKENDLEELLILKAKPSHKRKLEVLEEEPKNKKLKIKLSPSKASSTQPKPQITAPTSKLSLTIKLGPRPALESFPCCLCISMDKEGLLRVYDPPIGRKDIEEAAGNPKEWMAHEYCAQIIPETWIDEIELRGVKEKVVYGVDAIVRDRWHLKCSACTKNRPKMHGAPIQCTKGKCSKAFHVSCARAGAASNILYNVVREVEKEVLLIGPAAPTTVGSTATGLDVMQVDSVPPTDAQGMSGSTAQVAPHVLKTIKKLEVQVLCPQHNPVVAAAKKEAKQDKIKAELMALPEMARIKLRVSSGVFEVSLIRVIEATSSVEVLWDKGERREFKWSSVIFGNTDIPVQQKPTEMAIKPEPATTGSHPYAHLSRYYPSQTTNPEYWRYQNTQYTANPYAYSQYFSSAGSQYSLPYAYQGQNPYRTAQYGLQQQSYQGQPKAYSQTGPQTQRSSTDQSHSSVGVQPPQPQLAEPTQIGNTPSQPPGSSQMQTPPSQPVLTPEVQQALYSNLAALSSLQPDQFGELLRNNPHLRDVALAAVGREVQKS